MTPRFITSLLLSLTLWTPLLLSCSTQGLSCGSYGIQTTLARSPHSERSQHGDNPDRPTESPRQSDSVEERDPGSELESIFKCNYERCDGSTQTENLDQSLKQWNLNQSQMAARVARPIRKIAIFGGSFDPPTEGHLQVAAGVVQARMADEVWLMPCGRRPDKPSLKTSVYDRYVMTQMAVNEKFDARFPIRVEDLEIHLPQFIPTLHAYEQLREKYAPKEDSTEEKEFYFVIGSDLVKDINKWTDGTPGYAQRVWDEIPFLIYQRDGYPLTEPELPKRAELIQTPENMMLMTNNHASSELRKRIKHFGRKSNGERDLTVIDGLVPSSVRNFIERENLYDDL